MKYVLSLLLVCCTMLLQAQNFKPNYKAVVRPYEFKVEKVKVENGETVIFLKIKQQKNFSYSISFADCSIITPSNPDGIKGKLNSWNDDVKIYRDEKTISDEDWEECTLAFPGSDVIASRVFDLKVGNILDRNKTEILFQGIRIKKK